MKVKNIKKLVVLLLLHSVPSFVFLQEVKPENEIVVTDVQLKKVGNKTYAEIVINDLVKIREIEVTKIGDRTIVKYPTYVSKSGRVYPQVKIVSKQANDAILEAINTGKVSKPAKISKLDYEITKFSPYRREGSSLKIFAAVTFNKAIEIECKVMEGKRGPWISWPARKDESTGQWVKQVLLKADFKKEVDDALLKRYQTFKETGAATEEESEWR